MGRPDNERCIFFYTSSKKQKQQLQAMAKEAGVPLSKFLLSKIEESLAPKKKNAAIKAKELNDLRERVQHLEEELRLKDLMLQKAEERHEALAFLDESTEGHRKYSESLIRILKANSPVNNETLLALMEVDPLDVDLTKAISRELEALEGYGFIKKISRGWKWIG